MTRLADNDFLDLVQSQTLTYFWDFAHPDCGLARERSNPAPGYDYRHTVTTGGTGFGIMALLAGAMRGFLPRKEVVARIGKITDFLLAADRFHGAFPHFLDGRNGKTVPFSEKDDGGDLVETAFLVAGLLTARQFIDDAGLSQKIDRIWHAVEWDWYRKDGGNVLYWHWSPKHGWAMNHAIRGWNECLIVYILAHAAPRHAVPEAVYHEGWTDSPVFRNGKTYHDIPLPLGPPYGGPLFFSHYSFLGLDPRGLQDRYADYWQQNQNHARINLAWCRNNGQGHAGYGGDCWGLTASDGDQGYNAFCPQNDLGVIAPTAAAASMPYVPDASMRAMRYFYDDLGDRIWGDYGFRDAFNGNNQWVADSNLAINQGPIVVMIENHRSGRIWDLFMSIPEVQGALRRLDFQSPHLHTTA